MKRWHTREDSGIKLDAEGRWWHDGERVEHPKIAAAFDAGLRPTDDGRFTLVVGDDWCFVEVQGPAYRVVEAWPLEGQARVELSDGSHEQLDPSTLSIDLTGVLTCRVKSGRALARFSRSAQVRIGACLEAQDGKVFLRLAAQRFITAVEVASLEG